MHGGLDINRGARGSIVPVARTTVHELMAPASVHGVQATGRNIFLSLSPGLRAVARESVDAWEGRGVNNPGIDAILPRHWAVRPFLGADDLRIKIEELRETTGYRVPIFLKMGATRPRYDVAIAAKVGADVVVVDGAEGGTGASPESLLDHTGIPTLSAIRPAREALDECGLSGKVSLVNVPGRDHRPGAALGNAPRHPCRGRADCPIPHRDDDGDHAAGEGVRKVLRTQSGGRGSACALP